jgi:hypothetical protein
VSREMILDGFKVVVPLTPESTKRVETVARGLKAIQSRLTGASVFLFMPNAERDAIGDALRELVNAAEALLVVSAAAAGPSSPTPKS